MVNSLKFQGQYFLLLSLSLVLFSCASSEKIPKNSPKAKEDRIKETYAQMLKVDESKIRNIPLYTFIDDWYGVPYKYAGKSKSGIDCSGFTCALYQSVFNKSLAGSSASLYEKCKTVKKSDLEEGDLVFFKIGSDKISHVGIYLQNNKFVHASTKKGVIINDLDEEYYKKYFFKGGRFD